MSTSETFESERLTSYGTINFDTIVISNKSETMKVKSEEGNTPSFMKDIKSEEIGEITDKIPVKYTVEDLKNQIKILNERYNRDCIKLKNAYDERRKQIEAEYLHK